MLLEWTVFFMVENKRLKTWELAALIALCVTLCVGLWARGRQAEVSGKLIRLRVVAVSDAPEEQQIKLRVRDAVLGYLRPLLSSAADADAARKVVRLIDVLEEHDDVQNVYANFDIPDEVAAQLDEE